MKACDADSDVAGFFMRLLRGQCSLRSVCNGPDLCGGPVTTEAVGEREFGVKKSRDRVFSTVSTLCSINSVLQSRQTNHWLQRVAFIDVGCDGKKFLAIGI